MINFHQISKRFFLLIIFFLKQIIPLNYAKMAHLFRLHFFIIIFNYKFLLNLNKNQRFLCRYQCVCRIFQYDGVDLFLCIPFCVFNIQSYDYARFPFKLLFSFHTLAKYGQIRLFFKLQTYQL